MVRKCLLSMAASTALMLTGSSLALADNPGTTGQPNQSCEASPVTPGNAANAPGSAFNPNGQAGTVYAGQQPQNSRNPPSVSQDDGACFQPTRHLRSRPPVVGPGRAPF